MIEYPEQRYTRKESLIRACKDASLMLLPALSLMLLLLLVGADKAFLRHAGVSPAEIEFMHGNAFFLLAVFLLVFYPPFILLGYMQKRSTPTRDERRDQDYRRMNALMLQYPEYRTPHQQRVENAAEALLGKVGETTPEAKALRDALTWQ